MLLVLKRTVSMRRFFSAPKHTFKLMDNLINTIKVHKLSLSYGNIGATFHYIRVASLCKGMQYILMNVKLAVLQ